MKRQNRNALYWKCQLAGWSLASLYWASQGFWGGGFNLWVGGIQFVSDVILYIGLTHLYRNFVLKHQWQQLDLNGLVKRIIPAILVMGLAYTAVTLLKVYLIRIFFLAPTGERLADFIVLNGAGVFMAGIRLMSIWLLAYHIYQYAQREIRLTRENAKLVIVSRDAQLNNLSAQLNPHFLFNSLNTIKSLIATEPVSARRGIDLLSELLRNGLYQSGSVRTTVKEEMALLKDYLDLEKMRMEERLHFTVEYDPSLEMHTVPRLAIQTLVENAVKHGVSHRKDGGSVTVSLTRRERYMLITIENTGTIPANATGGVGIKNLKERCLIMYNGDFIFRIEPAGEGKVRTTLLIPAT